MLQQRMKMKRILCCLVAVLVLGATQGWRSKPDEQLKLKCLIQLTNYSGEGAYMAASLIDQNGTYEQTLYVMGQDEKWYNELVSWFSFFEKKKEAVDAISGATIAGGERTICVLEIPKEKLDKGYKLRFETSVESQKYYENDVEVALTSSTIKGNYEGTGYIRYVRLIPN